MPGLHISALSLQPGAIAPAPLGALAHWGPEGVLGQWSTRLEEATPTLARTWTASHRLLHLATPAAGSALPGWAQGCDGRMRMACRAVGLAERSWRWWRHQPAAFDLVLASTEAEARELFDQDGLAWWAQAQCVLLAPRGAPPPALGVHDMLCLLGAPDVALATCLRLLGVQAVIRPLVDGAGALITPLAEGVAQGLRQAAREAGTTFS